MEYRSLGCFCDLSVVEVRRVWRLGQQVHIPQGWSLILEPGQGDGVHLILSGTMEVIESGDELSERGAGEVLRGLPQAGQSFRTAVVTATSDVEALLFPAGDFRTAMTEVGAFGEAITRMESSRRGADRPST